MRLPRRTLVMKACGGVAFAIAVIGGACAEPEPSFAPPGALRGRKLPGVKDDEPAGAPGVFGSPYDVNAFRPATTMKKAHLAKGQGLEPGHCLFCHKVKDGGPGAPAFAYGGRVVVGREGTVPAPNVDVIVIQGDVKLGPVKSDEDGYFWLKSDVDVTDGRTTVRNANGEEPMVGKLFGGYGSCMKDGCHGQTPGQPQVYVEK